MTGTLPMLLLLTLTKHIAAALHTQTNTNRDTCTSDGHTHTMGMFPLSSLVHMSGATTEQLSCVMAAGLIRSEIALLHHSLPPQRQRVMPVNELGQI